MGWIFGGVSGATDVFVKRKRRKRELKERTKFVGAYHEELTLQKRSFEGERNFAAQSEQFTCRVNVDAKFKAFDPFEQCKEYVVTHIQLILWLDEQAAGTALTRTRHSLISHSLFFVFDLFW